MNITLALLGGAMVLYANFPMQQKKRSRRRRKKKKQGHYGPYELLFLIFGIALLLYGIAEPIG